MLFFQKTTEIKMLKNNAIKSEIIQKKFQVSMIIILGVPLIKNEYVNKLFHQKHL